MTTTKLNASPVVISFDGEVFEIFPQQRIHISQIRSIDLTTERQGKHTLRLDSPVSNWGATVDEASFPKVSRLVAEFQKAKAEYTPE